MIECTGHRAQGTGLRAQGSGLRAQGNSKNESVYSTDSLPEIYFLHFSITCSISSGRLESKESLLPVTG